MHNVAGIWSAITTAQPAPTTAVIAASGAVGAAAVVLRRPWSLSRHAVTLAHEAAHGLTAVASGRRLAGIRLHPDSSGITLSRGRPAGPGMVAMLFAGYLGPALLGLAAAATAAAGHAIGLLWALLVLLALLVLQVRNLFGVWSVLITAAVVFAVTWWLPGRYQAAFGYTVCWFLLLAAPRSVLELVARRRRRAGLMSDPDQLARITPLPAAAWIGLWLLASLGALVGGGALLL